MPGICLLLAPRPDLRAQGAASAPPATAVAALLPPHPRLLLNADGVAALKQRIAAAPWARASWNELKAAADRTLEQPMELPPRGGNWSHHYVCPTHGARLTQGKRLGPWQWEHLCPAGHHILRGDPSKASLDFDGNAIMGIHADLARQTVNDGLLYQVTGEARYARKARDLLLAYAARYLEYPLHDNRGNPGQGGRVASQSLTEASWLIEIAQGADLIWSTLSAAERQTLTEQLLRPALEQIILRRRLGIHNIQCRHNSAIGLVGFLLGDTNLLARAVDDPVTGFRRQVERGVLEDGMWLEGSSGYHFFTVAGLWPLAEAARNCGLDLYGTKFQKMFDGPLALAMPDLVLPNFNDSGTVPLEGQADHYELAFARFGNPAYVSLLAGSDRGGRLALLYGVPKLPAPASLAVPGSRNSPGSGYAILQAGNDRQATWLCLKYGPHGGGHGHPDKNNFILYARGDILAPDAGTHAYGSVLHGDWDKTTLAHNTLVVDQESQAPATGKCLAFGRERGVDYAMTDAGAIYKGVSYIRTVALLNQQLVLFVDQVRADAARTLDLAYHQLGAWEGADGPGPAAGDWARPEVRGYSRFSQARVRQIGAEGLVLKTRISDDWRPSVTLAPGEATEVITGYGILKTTEDQVPMLIQRRRARETVFVWAIAIDGAPVSLETSAIREDSGPAPAQSEAVLVHARAGGRAWSLLVNPRQKSLVAAMPDGAAWRSQAAVSVR